MNSGIIPKTEAHSGSTSNGDEPMGSSSSTPSNSSVKHESGEQDRDSVDDSKDDAMNAAHETGGARMSLRDRRNRKPTNYKYSEDVSPVAATERRTGTRAAAADKAGSSQLKSEMSNWLQCDLCHKWRLVAAGLFDELKKLDHFTCKNLQGVTCKDRDDWQADSIAGSEDSSKLLRSTQASRFGKPNRSMRVNIFAGRYIPGFAGEFSDAEEF